MQPGHALMVSTAINSDFQGRAAMSSRQRLDQGFKFCGPFRAEPVSQSMANPLRDRRSRHRSSTQGEAYDTLLVQLDQRICRSEGQA